MKEMERTILSTICFLLKASTAVLFPALRIPTGNTTRSREWERIPYFAHNWKVGSQKALHPKGKPRIIDKCPCSSQMQALCLMKEEGKTSSVSMCTAQPSAESFPETAPAASATVIPTGCRTSCCFGDKETEQCYACWTA